MIELLTQAAEFRIEEYGRGLRPVLIGGQAAVIHGHDRATEDFDVALRSGDNLNIESMLRDLPSYYNIQRSVAEDADIFGGAWHITSDGMTPVQLLNMMNPHNPTFHPGHVVHDFVEEVELAGHTITICEPEALIALKWYAGSKKDIDDAEALLNLSEIDLEKVRLIFERCKRLDIFERYVTEEA